MRENSRRGWPAFKSLSRDGGRSWAGPYETLMGGAHRPTAGLLPSGRILVTYRYFPGGGGWRRLNTFAYIEEVESALEPDPSRQAGALLPLDHDRSPAADSGYTGWVVLPDRVTIFVVNYIVDDAPRAQIRGYYVYERMW
jgi:sialidase-1